MGLAMKRTVLFMLPILVFIGLGNCGILGGEDEEKPIEWEEENLKGLVVYGFTGGGNILHMVNLENDAILNIHGINNINSVAASADGSKLFVSSGEGLYGGDPGYVTMIDTETWASEIIYDRSVELFTNGIELYFITKLNHLGGNEDLSHMREFGKIDFNTGMVQVFDEIDVFALGIGDDRSLEICYLTNELFGLDADFELFKYSIGSKTKEKLFNEFEYVNHAKFELSKDCETLFFSNGPVLNLKQNKQVGSIPAFRLGQLVARGDKREVYISGPDDFGIFGPSLKKLTIYDPKLDALIDTLDVNSITDDVYLSPKERFLITNSWINVFVIDLKTRGLVKQIHLPESVSNFEKFYLFKQPITKGETNENIYIE